MKRQIFEIMLLCLTLYAAIILQPHLAEAEIGSDAVQFPKRRFLVIPKRNSKGRRIYRGEVPIITHGAKDWSVTDRRSKIVLNPDGITYFKFSFRRAPIRFTLTAQGPAGQELKAEISIYEDPRYRMAIDSKTEFFFKGGPVLAQVFARKKPTPQGASGEVTEGVSTGAYLKYQLGLGLSQNLSRKLSVDFGVFFLTRKIVDDYAALNFNYLKSSLIFRYHFFRLFNVGLGPYLARGVGDVTVLTKASKTSEPGLHSGIFSQPYKDAGYSPWDWGAVVSAQGRYALDEGQWVLAGELFYEPGLANVSVTHGIKRRFHEFGVLLGIQMGFSRPGYLRRI